MSKRAYPLTEEQQLKQRILTPQPARPFSPPLHLLDRPPAPAPSPTKPPGCVFTKPCQLPDGITHYADPCGFVPLELVKEYGHFSLLGGREVDARGTVSLRKISGSALPVGLGQLALRAAVLESAATAVGSVAGALLTGLVALAWPSALGDSALYSDEQLRSMQRARSQMRLHVEQLKDGTLKGYGFYTGNNADCQMIDVVQLQSRGDQFVADLGQGVEQIWTPAVESGGRPGNPSVGGCTAGAGNLDLPAKPEGCADFGEPGLSAGISGFYSGVPGGVGGSAVVCGGQCSGWGSYLSPQTKTPSCISESQVGSLENSNDGGGQRPRWKDPDGTIYEWDAQHGAVEKSSKRGIHLGEFDHLTGNQRKPAKPERTVEP